jgi:hypothetical protein
MWRSARGKEDVCEKQVKGIEIMSVKVDPKEWKHWKPSKAFLKETDRIIKEFERQERKP